MEGYMTLKETAAKWNMSDRRINVYCAEGRIPGVQRAGLMWLVPENAEKPKDARVKSGKYIKKKAKKQEQ